MDPIFNFSNPITANGDYNITGLTPGARYQITAKDTWGGGNITLKDDSGPGGDFAPMINSTMNASNDWLQIDAQRPSLRITLADAITPELQITLVRLF